MKNIAIILLFFIALTLTAQNISVKSFKPLEKDMQARLHPELTPDNDPCILTKVTITKPIGKRSDYTFDVGSAILCKVEIMHRKMPLRKYGYG